MLFVALCLVSRAIVAVGLTWGLPVDYPDFPSRAVAADVLNNDTVALAHISHGSNTYMQFGIIRKNGTLQGVGSEGLSGTISVLTLGGIAGLPDGGIWIGGGVSGNLDNGATTPIGGRDCYWIRYSPSLTRMCIAQEGSLQYNSVVDVSAISTASYPQDAMMLVDNSAPWTIEFYDGSSYIGRQLDRDFIAVRVSPSCGIRYKVQFGSVKDDIPVAVSCRSEEGDCVFVGWTLGEVTGKTNSGGEDAMVARLLWSTGEVLWLTQFGGPGDDRATGSVTLLDRIYVSTSFSQDMGVVSLDSTTGEEVWRSIVASSPLKDVSRAIGLLPNGHLLVVGDTYSRSNGDPGLGPPGGSPGTYSDIVVVSVSPTNGQVDWISQWGAGGHERAQAIIGGDLLVGSTDGTIPQGWGSMGMSFVLRVCPQGMAWPNGTDVYASVTIGGGLAAEAAKSFECVSCAAQEVGGGLAPCISCMDNDIYGQGIGCWPCPNGSHTPLVGPYLGTDACWCDPGRAPVGVCSLCEAGWYAPGGNASASCQSCPVGMYGVAGRGASSVDSCALCPTGYALTDPDRCVPCPVGEYSIQAGVSSCSSCPEGMECSTPGVFFVRSSSGWWMEESGTFAPCHPSSVCEAGNLCRKGHLGERCEECVIGYYRARRTNGLCEPCPALAAWFLIALLLLMAITVGALVRLARHTEHAGYFATVSVGFSFLQIVSVLIDFDIKWPPAVFSLFRVISAAAFEIEIFHPQCAIANGELGYREITVLTLVLPLVFFLFLGIAAGGETLWWRCKLGKGALRERHAEMHSGMENPASAIRRRSANILLVILSLLYLTITNRSLSVFACAQDPNDANRWIHASSPSNECYGSWWRGLLLWCMMGMIIYVIGIPLLFLYVLRLIRRKYDRKTAIEVAGLLFLRYHRRAEWYEIVVLIRKFGVSALGAFFFDRPLLQGVLVIVMLLGIISVQWWVAPYRSIRVDDLDRAGIGTAALVLGLGVCLMITPEDAQAVVSILITVGILLLVVGMTIAILISALIELRYQVLLRKGKLAGGEMEVEEMYFMALLRWQMNRLCGGNKKANVPSHEHALDQHEMQLYAATAVSSMRLVAPEESSLFPMEVAIRQDGVPVDLQHCAIIVWSDECRIKALVRGVQVEDEEGEAHVLEKDEIFVLCPHHILVLKQGNVLHGEADATLILEPSQV